MLEVKLKKKVGTTPDNNLVLDLDFTIENGFTVFTGKSGAGKTSTLRLIAGITNPDEGFIKLDSTVFFDSAQNFSLPIQKRRVGFVFQDYALFPHFTAEQNIIYGCKEIDKSRKTEIAREMLQLFHIENVRFRRPNEMSGGEQQRVAIARALASAPSIVLLDEPLSAVDAETRTKLFFEIERAQEKFDIPFIYVTHNENEADRFGHRRLAIEDGIIR